LSAISLSVESRKKDVDGCDKRGHDAREAFSFRGNALWRCSLEDRIVRSNTKLQLIFLLGRLRGA
jgi:hypothetical protein